MPIAYRHKPEIIDTNFLNAVPGITLASNTNRIWPDFASLAVGLDATLYHGEYATFLNEAGSPVFAISDGTVWRPTGAVVAGGYALPTWQSVIDAGLAAGTLIYWVPTGLMYVMSGGTPLPTEFVTTLTPTKLAGFAGTEASTAAMDSVTPDTTGSASLTFQQGTGSDAVRLFSTTLSRCNLRLDAAEVESTLGTRRLLSGFCRVEQQDGLDTSLSHLITAVSVSNGNFIAPATLSSKVNGASFYQSNLISVDPDSSLRAETALQIGGPSYVWFDLYMLETGPGFLFVNHRLEAVMPPIASSTSNRGIIGDYATADGDDSASLWKHVSYWEAA